MTPFPLPELNKQDYKPLYVRLSEALAEWLQKNNFKAGEPIPSEKKLMEHYGISRMTVRLAVQRLETADLVTKVQGKGTFVSASVGRSNVRGFQNIEERMAELGIKVSNILLESLEIYPPPNLAKELNIPNGTKAWLIRRLKTSQGSPLAMEVRLLPLEIANRYSPEEFKNRPFFRLLQAYPDSQIHNVNYCIGSRVITNQEAEYLKASPQTIVLVRKGVYTNQQDQPVMVSRVTFLADKFELQYGFRQRKGNWLIVRAG